MKTKKELLSTIIYEQNEIPVYLPFNKKILRFIIFAFPLVSVILATALIVVLANFRYLGSFSTHSGPNIINELKDQNKRLTEQISSMSQARKELEHKISSTDQSQADLFSIFKTPPGQIDLSATPSFGIESLVFDLKDSSAALSFNLKNLKEETKQSGHIFVIMQERSSIQIYPKESLPLPGEKISFSSGEAFATSRFRPVAATFARLEPNITPVFTVILFNKNGDVIHKELLKK